MFLTLSVEAEGWSLSSGDSAIHVPSRSQPQPQAKASRSCFPGSQRPCLGEAAPPPEGSSVCLLLLLPPIPPSIRIFSNESTLSMGFSRQEDWSGLPFPSPRYLLYPGIKPMPPTLAGGLFTTYGALLWRKESHCPEDDRQAPRLGNRPLS